MDLEATLEYNRWSSKDSKSTEEDGHRDPERHPILGMKKAPYPKSVFLIFITEICERFSYFGMRAVLTLYLTSALMFTDSTATILYHTFVMISYMAPVVGGIIADSRLGKFRTIMYLSIVYAIGNITLSLAATPALHIPAITFSMIGLVLQGLGTGGIKANVAAFGGDQFIIPQQETKLAQFFFIFYFCVNCGATISTFVTPLLRDDVSCFGEQNCYTLAFGLPAVLMIIALVIFLLGRPLYKIRIPQENVFLQAIGCIARGVVTKISNKSEINHHWLDGAADKYDKNFIEDLKQVLNIFVLFIPFPIFWSLFEQTGSTWTLQATRMNGYVTSSWTLKPDQMQTLDPLLILIFIPLFERVIYPLLGKCGLFKNLLQRMIFGAFLTALSFVLAGTLEIYLEPTYAVIPGTSESNLNFINTLPCTLNISLTSNEDGEIFNNSTFLESTETELNYASGNVLPSANFVFKKIPARSYNVNITSAQRCFINGNSVIFGSTEIQANSAESTSVLIEIDSKYQMVLAYPKSGDDLTKSANANAKLRVISTGLNSTNSMLVLTPFTTTGVGTLELPLSQKELATNTMEIEPARYSGVLHLDSSPEPVASSDDIILEEGGSYVLGIFPNYTTNSKSLVIKLYVLTNPNSVPLLLQTPQYVVLTLGEIFFAVTGYTVAYSQAPRRFKSVIMSVWLLADGLGSLIIIIVTEANIFPRQAVQFYMYAVLMLLATILFFLLAQRYEFIETQHTTPLLSKNRRIRKRSFIGLESSTDTENTN